ncbi:hypothetical protein [Pinibacter soli]|uniref:Uncharacterized protein n=1 Tax=Pinibacter soli TaxID=3044211 RepID=A0ABT6R6Y1_9BACT|nr:hypothetical protein [Pinibacter soli]MDI3318226.1 hypothetical protein [Pinibacter soli]
MKKLFFGFIACLSTAPSFAQTQQQLPEKILNYYPPAVITKMYEAVNKVNLTDGEMLQLAVQYRKEDSTLFTMARQGKTLQELEKVRSECAQAVMTIIGKERYKKINTGSVVQQCNCDSASGEYLKRRTKELQAIKPLDNIIKIKLEKAFQKELTNHKDDGWASNFNEAMRKTISDTLYFAQLYSNEIDQTATSNAKQYFYPLIKSKKITKAGRDALFPIVYEKKRQLAIVDKMYPLFTKEKDSLITAIENLYTSSIAVSQKRYGGSLSASQLTTLIKLRSVLNLSETQVDSIMVMAATIQAAKDELALKDPVAKYDSKPYESTVLPSILTEEQYAKAMVLNNKSKAEQDAQRDWKELETAGLATNYDKEATIKQLTSYHIARACATYKYSYDREKQKANVRSIDDHMPAALKALKSARKYNNPSNTPQGSFQW